MSAARAVNAPIENDPFETCDIGFLHDLNGVEFDNAEIGTAGSIFGPTAIKLEETTLNDVQQAFLTRMDRMEQNVTFMLKRIFTEVIVLRKENATLKARLQEAIDRIPAEPTRNAMGARNFQTRDDDLDEFHEPEVDCDVSISEQHEVTPFRRKDKSSSPAKKKPHARAPLPGRYRANSVIPTNPFTAVDDFMQFEQEISEDVDKEQCLVDQFAAVSCSNPDKYIRVCWRKLINDPVAARFCWSGTAVKKSIRDMSVTLAIQTAFQQKFDDDGTFERVTQKHFNFAPARLDKIARYQKKLSIKIE